MGRIFRAGLIAGVVAAIINVVIALVARSVIAGVPGDFGPFAPFAVASSTIFGALAGAAVFALISRVSRRPVPVFTVVAVLFLLFSFASPLYIMGSDSPRFAGANGSTAAALILMHLVTGITTIRMLTSTARGR